MTQNNRGNKSHLKNIVQIMWSRLNTKEWGMTFKKIPLDSLQPSNNFIIQETTLKYFIIKEEAP